MTHNTETNKHHLHNKNLATAFFAIIILTTLLVPVTAQIAPDWGIGPGWNMSTTVIITASAGAGGTITPQGSISVIQGYDQTFTITPNIGYATSSIIVDGSPVTIATSYTFTNVSIGHTIAVYFAINTYTITSYADANSQITPSGATTVNYGDNAYYSYSANSGYQISEVLVDGVPTSISSPSGTYAFSNVQANHNISISSTLSPTPTPTATPTTTPSPSTSTSPNPHNHPTETLNLYMRSDTYNFSDISAYGLDKDYTNSYVSVPITSATENATVTYGFRAYLTSESDTHTELTDGTPNAQIILSSNYTGQISSSWTCPDTTVVLGRQILKINLYAKIGSGDWGTPQATFITPALMTQELMPATWTITLNIAMTQLVGNTTSILTFGDTDHRSTLNGVVIVTPNYVDIVNWQQSHGDYIGIILGQYLHILGPIFYLLIYVMIFGGLWLRHRSVNPIIFLAVILGGASGLGCWVLLPLWASLPLSVFIILGIMALFFKILR